MGIRVLVADDHEVVRTGLASLLKGSEITIVGEATNGQEAVERADETNPDVVLMDIRMPEEVGLSALETMRQRHPDMRVVMLSTYDNPTYVARSVALGAAVVAKLLGPRAVARLCAGRSAASRRRIAAQVRAGSVRRSEHGGGLRLRAGRRRGRPGGDARRPHGRAAAYPLIAKRTESA